MPSKPLHVRLREKRNRAPAGEPWVWMTRELIESEAWGSLSRAALKVIFRVMIEHMAHAGTENANLIVTYADFAEFGVRPNSIKGAIEALIKRGLLIRTQPGKPSVGADRFPARYAIGWLPTHDGASAPNRWKAWRLRAPIAGNINSSNGNDTGKRHLNGAHLHAS